MYYRLELEEKVRLPPSLLVMKLKEAVLKMLRDKYERTLAKDFGLILAVEDVEVGDTGIVIPGDGGIFYTAKFDALTFIPHVNEVYEGEVKEIVEFGAFIGIGPLDGLVHISQIGNEKFFYDKKSKSLTTRGGMAVKKGDKVRVKVSTVSMKGTTSDTRIGLTMRAEGLGSEAWDRRKLERKKAAKEAKKAAKRK